MYCPKLGELPPPPEGKTGWPWTEESSQRADAMPDGNLWPRISIITPSYNQGQFIEETIRSVLLQGYPELEYIIIDGGSSDNSIEIIEKYSPWLKYWVSEPDDGQAGAINKGMAYASGSWVNWLNSDDLLLPGALAKLGVSASAAGRDCKGLSYSCRIVTIDGEVLETWKPRVPEGLKSFLKGGGAVVLSQPSTFIRRDVFCLDSELHYVMDWALYIDIVTNHRDAFCGIDEQLAAFRLHDQSKTSHSSRLFVEEALQVIDSLDVRGIRDKGGIYVWRRRVLFDLYLSDLLSEKGTGHSLWVALTRWPEIIFSRSFWGAVRLRLR